MEISKMYFWTHSDSFVDSSSCLDFSQKLGLANLSFQKIFDGSEKASWDAELRNIQMLSCVDLRDWFVIHAVRDGRAANDFIQALSKVSLKNVQHS